MLPDLPGLKKDLQKVFDQWLRTQVNERLGVFGEAPKHVMHEGNRTVIIRADGSVEESQLQESSAEMTLKLADVPGLSLQERVMKLTDVANQMADQIAGHLLKDLNKGLDVAGQVVDHKGKPLDADALFAVLEKIQIDFDDTGQQHHLTMLIPPGLMPRVEELKREFETDQAMQRRYEEIIATKREEWRDREAARKLVG